jgi:hypothetical protein
MEKVYAAAPDLGSIDARYAKFPHTTLQEYFEMSPAPGKEPSPDNPAAKQVDNGKEPYLLNLEAQSLGIWPWRAVYDLSIDMNGGMIGVELPASSRWLPPDTLVFWR